MPLMSVTSCQIWRAMEGPSMTMDVVISVATVVVAAAFRAQFIKSCWWLLCRSWFKPVIKVMLVMMMIVRRGGWQWINEQLYFIC